MFGNRKNHALGVESLQSRQLMAADLAIDYYFEETSQTGEQVSFAMLAQLSSVEPCVERSDINQDGVLSALDALLIANVMNGGESNYEVDVTQDGVVNEDDFASLVDMFLECQQFYADSAGDIDDTRD